MTATSVEVSGFRAVVPQHIARKWNAIALQQLADAASRLDEELTEERRYRYVAEDQAIMWEEVAQIHEGGGEAGLTVDGQIVQMMPDRAEQDFYTDRHYGGASP